MKFRDILLATDDYKLTSGAIDIGIELALISGAKLHIISVVDTRAIISTGAVEHLYGGLKKGAEKAIEDVIKEIGDKKGYKKIEVTRHIVNGKPSEKILNYTIENKIDIIVMGKKCMKNKIK